MPSRPSVEEDNIWALEEEEDEEGGFDDYEHFQPAAPQEDELQEIGSLDEFMDEVQRLAQCVEGGQFQRLLARDEGRSIKLGLAARQLRFLADAVSAIVQASDRG
jgi:hypothetical protein